MPRPYRRVLPTASVPRFKPKRRGGATFALALHVAIIGLLVYERVPDGFENADGAGGPGARGGGGGGGSGSVTFVQMPAYRPPSSELTFRVETDDAVEQVEPEIVIQPTLSRSSRTTRDPNRTPTRNIGAGRGLSSGEGRGPGSGGGTGSGEGTGTGSDRGPGTGGGGSGIFPPSPRNISLPPQPTPDGVKGKSFNVRFSVDEAGVVTNVSISPRVEESEYRQRWMRQLRDFIFNPATSADGTPIPSEFTMEIRVS